MDTKAIHQAIDSIEHAVDKTVQQLGQLDAELQRAIQGLHQQDRSKRELSDEKALKQAAIDIEQAADSAMDACRKAGRVDPALQQAVKEAHQKASQLKYQVQACAAG